MHHKLIPSIKLCLLPLVITASPVASQEVELERNPESGLFTWKVQQPGFSLQFIQLLPDYIRAIYSARGLPRDLVETMAGYCVFGTIIKNESDGPLSYRVADWRYVTADGQAHPIKTKTQWVNEWRDQGVSFRWSILPDDQRFAPGDWSQGFTTIPLPPDSVFNLNYSWTDQGETHHGTFEKLRCAPTQAPKP